LEIGKAQVLHFGNVITKPWAKNNLASYFFRIKLHLPCEGSEATQPSRKYEDRYSDGWRDTTSLPSSGR